MLFQITILKYWSKDVCPWVIRGIYQMTASQGVHVVSNVAVVDSKTSSLVW